MLTIPVRNVSCGQASLDQLLADIDAMCWADPNMARVFCGSCRARELWPAGWAVVASSTGCGFIRKWKSFGVRQDAEDLLRGQRARMEITGKRWF